jgi:large subunit ribosomal protein L18
MSVVKTNRHIAVQLIDDEKGHTLAAASTYSKKKGAKGKRNKESAGALGEAIASQAKGLGISEVIFDRGPFKYHGILAEVAQATRAHGVRC